MERIAGAGVLGNKMNETQRTGGLAKGPNRFQRS